MQVGQPNKLKMSITVIGVVKNTKNPTTIRAIFVALRSLLSLAFGTDAQSLIVSLSVNDRMVETEGDLFFMETEDGLSINET